jgi:MerR family transcriptional regulator/heat shock protein HspR
MTPAGERQYEMNDNRQHDDHEEPAFIISVAARMLGVHAQTLRYYERAGVIEPSRSSGRIRLYSRADIDRIRQVQRLIDELGVNLAGAEIIIKMSGRLRELEAENEALRNQLQRFRDTRLPAKREDNGYD